MKYKKSMYTRILKIDDDFWMVHNLSSGSECILDSQELKILNNCSTPQEDSKELLCQLYEMGIIVNDKVDEIACLELERKISMYSFTSDEVGFVIAPTMDCNAYCFYCYENETRKSCYMDERTEKALVEYIKNIALGKKRMYISWFGGEPLLCRDLIVRISNELTRFADENKIDYHCEITTNGYYLDKIIDDIHDLRISDIQVTLDGFKEEHEKRKHFLQNDSWERIVNNIYDFSSRGIHITLRFNFDKGNIQSIKEMVEFLIKQERWNENITIYFYPLEPNCIQEKLYFKEKEYEQVMHNLYTFLYNTGYYNDRKYALDFHKLSLPCYGATLGTVAIDYKGLIYQCQHLLCHEEYSIGDVFEGVMVTEKVNSWYDGTVSDKCKKCEVLPLCQGGCVTKPKLGKNEYVCHMMKYRIKTQERLKVQAYMDSLLE
ncbi:MAG: radical SAM protein [Ruminococcus sp.]